MTTEESRLRDRLIALADEAAPPDLSQRILEREEFTPGRRWPRRPTSSRAGGANRAVLLVAAAVVAIVVGTTAIAVANRGAPVGPPSPLGASSNASPIASASSAPATSAATEPSASSAPASAPASLPAQPGPSTARSGSADRLGSSAVLVARNAFPALDVQQTQPCARELPVPRADIGLLAGRPTISKAIVCTTASSYRGGHGLTTTIRGGGVDPADLPELAAELTAGDRLSGPDVACDRARLELDFVVYLNDGHVLRPGAPVDGCTVRARLIEILRSAHTSPDDSSSSLLPEKNAVTGCHPGAVVAEPFSSAPLGGDTLGLPTKPAFSVCRYSYDPQSGRTHLVATGTVAGKMVSLLVAARPVAPSATCTASDFRAVAEGGFLAVVMPPTRPLTTGSIEAAEPVLFLELAGCHRLLSGDGTVVESAPPSLIAEIAASATDPVPAASG
jgi:hypothetical protein